MPRFLNAFKNSEDGAVTVDWVVLCAAIVGLALVVIASINSGALTLAGNVDTYLNGQFFGE